MIRRVALVSAAGLVMIPAATASALHRHDAVTAVPSVAVQEFASQVETLGETSYGGSFAGGVLAPSGELTIYANPDADGALVAAVNRLNTGGFAVQYKTALIGYTELNTMTDNLTASQQQISADGIQLVQASQSPVSDTVQVTVAAPSASQTTELATAASRIAAGNSSPQNNSTSSTYLTNVASVIDSIVGPGYTVEPTYGTPAAPASRNVDSAPFFGGENITNNTESPTGFYFNCTSGFVVEGNASGRDFMLTAGHCGAGTYTIGNAVGGTTLGTTSSGGLYISDGNNDDFQTLSISSGAGYVWTGNSTSSSSAAVIGSVDPVVGSDITMDGGKTGEVSDTKVYGNNATIYGLTNAYNNTTYTAAHLIESESSNGSAICQGGDSGGPAIQRTNGSGVNAVGTIVAVYA